MRPSGSLRAIAAFLGLGCFAGGAVLAANYPIAPVWTMAGFVGWVAIMYLPNAWLLLLPALLPVVGFAPWTGWLGFEEFDILLLGAAAAGYARFALRQHERNRLASSSAAPRNAAHVSHAGVLLLALLVISSVISLYRGFHAAGSMELGWWGGYYDALNSLRIFKTYAYALLLVPLVADVLKVNEERALQYFSLGAAIGLAGAALAVLWERLAFTGLLNFSSDYRVTGLFWEMHVGGAALDGFLALTIPFAVWKLLRAEGIPGIALAAALLALATYACLVTFSRGLYIAALTSLAVVAILRVRQANRISRLGASAVVMRAALFLLFAVAISFLVFRSGGYRTLAAMLGVFAVSLSQGSVVRRAASSQWAIGLAIGVILGAVSLAAAQWISKGPYVVFAIALTCCAGLTLKRKEEYGAWVLLAAHVWVMIAAAMVALHWGGQPALRDCALALSILIVIWMWNARAAKPLWPESIRSRGIVIGVAAMIGATVAVFTGGTYMGGRFASTEGDLAGRVQHWRDGLDLLQGPADWWLGKGLGRFPASYFYGVRDITFPGSYRLSDAGGNPHLSLAGARTALGFGELLRVSQRVPVASGGIYSVVLDARAREDAALYLEICTKHLLYPEACASRAIAVKSSSAGWERIVLSLEGKNLGAGSWYAPQLAFFSLAVESNGRVIELDNVSLVGPDGTNLIANGDFSDGMAHWFFTSDRHHLPWHIKNLYLNVLFDQGIVGLCLFMLLMTGVLWRLVQGAAHSHPFAPFLAASLIGFLVVGIFDSLLDAPRVAVLFYLVGLLGLMLRRPMPKA